MQLAREHGIVGEPALLRPLDLAVPVGALDEAHGDAACPALATARAASAAPAIARACRRPARRCRARASRRAPDRVKAMREQVERQVEPVLLLRVDGEGKRRGARAAASSVEQARRQLAVEPLFLAGLEARMQGRELHRDAGPRHQRIRVAARSGRLPCRSRRSPPCSDRNSARRQPRSSAASPSMS